VTMAYGVPPQVLDHALALDLFWTISMFEVALKRGVFSARDATMRGTTLGRRGHEIRGRVSGLSLPGFTQSAESLVALSPRRQVVRDGGVPRDAVVWRPADRNEAHLLRLPRTAQNNLFHAESIGTGPVADVPCPEIEVKGYSALQHPTMSCPTVEDECRRRCEEPTRWRGGSGQRLAADTERVPPPRARTGCDPAVAWRRIAGLWTGCTASPGQPLQIHRKATGGNRLLAWHYRNWREWSPVLHQPHRSGYLATWNCLLRVRRQEMNA
jgi:hypothetical protein